MSSFIKLNNEWVQPVSYFKKENGAWTEITESAMRAYIIQRPLFYGGHLTHNTLSIGGVAQITGETCSYTALFNRADVTTATTWSIISGSQYATINSSTGVVTILSGASESEVVLQAVYTPLTATKTITLTYQAGTSSQTETEIVVNESGDTTITTTTVTTDASGTSVTNTSTQILDESGNTTGTQESVITENADGSFSGLSINYDAEGNPTEGRNVLGDVEGNVNTQEITYDESGNSIVTGYEIDTSGSDGAGKDISGDGVDTEFIPFSDGNCGFICHMVFETERAAQPIPPLVEDTEDTSKNYLYNVMSAKSTTKIGNAWPGFDIRWALSKTDGSASGTGIQFRYTQSGSTSTTAKDLTGKNADGTGTGNTYDLTIRYDPQLLLPDSRTTFSVTSANGCISSIGTNVLFVSTNIDFTLGYAINMQGEPYRYSNVIIHEFSITKICGAEIIIPATPVISCDGENVSITCETNDARIFYRVGSTGNYSRYNTPIAITADTVIYAYSEIMGQTSDTVHQTCIYDNGVEEPVIECTGTEVIITCATPSVTLYYRLNQSGSFIEYLSSISITANTIVETYAEVDNKRSDTVTETCIYNDGVFEPVISCSKAVVTITCATQGATIYYKLNEEVNYSTYSAPFAITANTTVYAYAEYSGDTSSVVNETCEYTHDYSEDYLSFAILTGGTVIWKANGSGYEKSIQYCINDDTWTPITATTGGTSITVSANDIVRFKGSNSTYAGSKSNYSGFEGGTAKFNIEGNIMSLVYGDNFKNNSTLSGKYNFCSIFKLSNAISAENLILPAATLTDCCYRAMFSFATSLEVAPALPATTLATQCYWYMFEGCAITEAPELVATTLVSQCYGNMFSGCTNLNYIKCLATNPTTSYLTGWTTNVAPIGIFVKSGNVSWPATGVSSIPTNWSVYSDTALFPPEIAFDGIDMSITCDTSGATIYYKIGESGTYAIYSSAVTLSADTVVYAYSEYGGNTSPIVNMECEYLSDVPFEYSNRDLTAWTYNNQTIQTPYSVNAIDGHTSSYAKGTFNFESHVNLKSAEPTYLWFQHADQSASIYVDNNLVEKHWGGYNAFFTDISNYVHSGTNNIKVALKNNEGQNLAPAAGDFNFNATLGNVKVFTSTVLPAMSYGYDGFHVVADVATSSATVTVRTNIPVGAVVVCEIDDGTYHFSDSGNSTGDEMTFTAIIQNPHLWNGTLDPHLYTITLEIYKNGDLYHKYQRPYGLRFYDYVYGDTSILPNNEPYTGFLLNGSPYYLRGVCMHDDVEGKANALSSTDYANEFSIIQELGCNFIRLAHYPHPKEVYDYCDQLGIIVQTEVPCVNKLQSTMPADYYTHLEEQYTDMVNQHYNHPCIMFWGLSNESTTDDAAFGKTKIEAYTSLIKSLDTERWVGYVMSHSTSNPSSYYNNPDVDWFGGNIYVGWYIDKTSNDPTSQLNTRVKNIITDLHKPLAFSEYGCGGTQHCHSDDPQNTTTKGNYERHDIEYMMWLHEGHIAAIKNFPQLLFSAEWQLFDIAVASRNEGYTVCLDGETTSTDDNLRRLNDKGLVERDHVTKKDTFYIYKAWWNQTDKFVHICGKDYQKYTDRVIKCYTNDGNSLSLYVNNMFIETKSVTDNIVEFTAQNFNSTDVIKVVGATKKEVIRGFNGETYEEPEQVRAIKFTLDSTSTSGTIGLSIPANISTDDIVSIEWSLNGTSWTTVNNVDETQVNVETSTLSPGDVVYFRGTGEHFCLSNTTHAEFSFSSGVKATCEGSMMSMLGKLDTDTLANHAFERLFSGCEGLLSAPELPATSLGKSCYERMFQNCTSLTEAPVLPAATLANSCYKQMFSGCTALSSITMLATNITADDCLYNWVKGVAVSGTFTKDSTMLTLPSGDSGIPSGWTEQDYAES